MQEEETGGGTNYQIRRTKSGSPIGSGHRVPITPIYPTTFPRGRLPAQFMSHHRPSDFPLLATSCGRFVLHNSPFVMKDPNRTPCQTPTQAMV